VRVEQKEELNSPAAAFFAAAFAMLLLEPF